jgi:hypothetical protein
MENSYTLVNPYISGEFQTTIKAKNSVEAGRNFYQALSEHFNNAVPKFYFTIQKGGSGKGKYYHFKVTENRNDDEVNFTLQPYNGPFNTNAFTNNINNIKQKIAQSGGKKSKKSSKKSKKVSESDSEYSSDTDSENYLSNIVYNSSLPFWYWWYDPSVYQLESIFIPTFYPAVAPAVIEIGGLAGLLISP